MDCDSTRRSKDEILEAFKNWVIAQQNPFCLPIKWKLVNNLVVGCYDIVDSGMENVYVVHIFKPMMNRQFIGTCKSFKREFTDLDEALSYYNTLDEQRIMKMLMNLPLHLLRIINDDSYVKQWPKKNSDSH